MATRQPDPDAVDAGVVARVIVRLLGELSITLGVFLMLFVAWQLWWTDVEANRDQSQQVSSLEQQFQAPADPVAAPVVGEPPPPAAPPAIPGEAFGIIYVPRFGADYARPVLAGTSLDILAKGVGHYIGSAMPGEVGNFAIAGHRTTHGAPFWAIDELQPGDPVVIFTADGYYTYRVRSSEIVRPGAVEVVAPVPDQPGAVPTERLLTMTSCHPRYTARQRFVVHAVFESFQPAAAGPPPALTGAG
jgi:sortase A